jgi:hypothetical protein
VSGLPLTVSNAGAGPRADVAKGDAIAAAIAYLETAPLAIEGRGGRKTTMTALHRCIDLGLPFDEAATLIEESDWNAGCSPPWARGSLASEFRNLPRELPVGARLAGNVIHYTGAQIEAEIKAADKGDVARVFVEMATAAGLNPVERKLLAKKAGELSGAGVRAIEGMLKDAAAEKRRERAAEKRRERAAASSKPTLPAPPQDAEIGPIMAAWDEVLANVDAPEPPVRDLAAWPVFVTVREPHGALHTLTAAGANDEEDAPSRLPPPKQALLTRHDVYSIEHEIGAHLTFLKETADGDEAVCPGRRFIEHWLHLRTSKLPVVTSLLTMPLVLPDGSLLARNGLDRNLRLIMRADPALLAYIPVRDQCSAMAVLKAFEFVIDEWFVDVAADLPSKCVLLAYALSVLERVLFPARPVFVVSAGQRASGKTTVLRMLVEGALGAPQPAAAWARDEDERRKALLGYLIEGLPTVVWDNIPSGSAISSAALERASTSETYSDRLLGASQTATASAYMIHAFTGNNIRVSGDLASRSLEARLAIDRPDPQNRPLRHADPIQWTRDHRGEILKAFYTILLGNPQLDPALAVEPKTRFKAWWSIVGSAVEHAADLYQSRRGGGQPLSFAAMFDAQDDEDDEGAEIGAVLDAIGSLWPAGKEFSAKDALARVEDEHDADGAVVALRQFMTKGGLRPLTLRNVGLALGAARDVPKARDGSIVTLRRRTLKGQAKFVIIKKCEPKSAEKG